MQEQYQNEINKLHAPQQLVDSTKELVKQKEKKNKGNVVSMKQKVITIGAVAACFLIACIVIPFTFLLDANKKPVYLGDSQSLSPAPIMKENDASEESLNIMELMDYPAEFNDNQAEEITLLDTRIRLLKDKKTGYYKACLEIKGTIFFADSKLKKRELFLDKLQVYIDSKIGDYK